MTSQYDMIIIMMQRVADAEVTSTAQLQCDK